MAKVTLTSSDIKASLADLVERTKRALASISDEGEIDLDIPEPYDHVVRQGPHVPTPCLVPPLFEECSDIGILMGVLKAMPEAGTKGSRATVNPRRKK